MSPDEERLVADIEKLVKRSIERLEYHGAPPPARDNVRVRAPQNQIVREVPSNSALLSTAERNKSTGSQSERMVSSRPAPRKEIAALLGGLKKVSQG